MASIASIPGRNLTVSACCYLIMVQSVCFSSAFAQFLSLLFYSYTVGTNKQLRSTNMGEELRKCGNLANPITFPKKQPANQSLEAELAAEKTMDKEELIRRIKGGDSAVPIIPLPGYRGRQRKLKFSLGGAKIRDGGDIVKPITKATVNRQREDVNTVAKPENLRSTAVGSKVREGKSLAAPVTKATVIKKYEWEKPSWAKSKGNEEAATEETQKPGFVDPLKQKKTYGWQKPDWTSRRLGETGKAEQMKEKGDLAAPITKLPDLAKSGLQ